MTEGIDNILRIRFCFVDRSLPLRLIQSSYSTVSLSASRPTVSLTPDLILERRTALRIRDSLQLKTICQSMTTASKAGKVLRRSRLKSFLLQLKSTRRSSRLLIRYTKLSARFPQSIQKMRDRFAAQAQHGRLGAARRPFMCTRRLHNRRCASQAIRTGKVAGMKNWFSQSLKRKIPPPQVAAIRE